MRDMLDQVKKLRSEARNSARISKEATEPQKRELFERLALHLDVLAEVVEREIAAQNTMKGA
jgi:hypothetical protein